MLKFLNPLLYGLELESTNCLVMDRQKEFVRSEKMHKCSLKIPYPLQMNPNNVFSILILLHFVGVWL
jgi:hypothetical protein